MNPIFWLGERVLDTSRAIKARCQCVDALCDTIPPHLELVHWDWETDLHYYAEPSLARVYRLWWPITDWCFWRVLILGKRLGFWRVEDGEYLHCGELSYPFDRRGMSGRMSPWEARVIGWWNGIPWYQVYRDSRRPA